MGWVASKIPPLGIDRYIPFVLTSFMKCARKLPTCVLNRKLKIFFRVRVRIRVIGRVRI